MNIWCRHRHRLSCWSSRAPAIAATTVVEVTSIFVRAMRLKAAERTSTQSLYRLYSVVCTRFFHLVWASWLVSLHLFVKSAAVWTDEFAMLRYSRKQCDETKAHRSWREQQFIWFRKLSVRCASMSIIHSILCNNKHELNNDKCSWIINVLL